MLRDRPRFRFSPRRSLAAIGVVATGGLTGCGSNQAPDHPTWANVQPIVAGACMHCHGANASTVASGFRFDFFDMTREVCGDAANALDPTLPLAKGLAPQITTSLTSTVANVRPSMPPLPAPYLSDWEWETILRWTADPQRGAPPDGNSPPKIRFENLQLDGLGMPVDKTLDLTAILEDREGDPVVGVLNLGSQSVKLSLRMDHSGSFSTRLDTSSWPAGPIDVSAVLCDGWSNVTYALGSVMITHLK